MRSLLLVAAFSLMPVQDARSPVPSSVLRYREFTMRFAPDGSFELQGTGYPTFKGTWKRVGADEVEIAAPNVRGGCPEAANNSVHAHANMSA